MSNPMSSLRQARYAAGKTAIHWLRKGMTFEKWIAIGEAFEEARQEAYEVTGCTGTNRIEHRAVYTKALHKILKREQPLDTIDSGARSQLASIMANLPAVQTWLAGLPEDRRRRLNHPSAVWRNFQKTQAPKELREAKPKRPKAHPADRDAVASLESELEEARAEVRRLKDRVAELEAKVARLRPIKALADEGARRALDAEEKAAKRNATACARTDKTPKRPEIDPNGWALLAKSYSVFFGSMAYEPDHPKYIAAMVDFAKSERALFKSNKPELERRAAAGDKEARGELDSGPCDIALMADAPDEAKALWAKVVKT
ncbi:MAG TPA: hypothetical protein VLZ74_01905 [Methylocella sp.]|nr:hypothetical protein [Methylocella sp.]